MKKQKTHTISHQILSLSLSLSLCSRRDTSSFPSLIVVLISRETPQSKVKQNPPLKNYSLIIAIPIMTSMLLSSTSQTQIFHNIRAFQPIPHLHPYRTTCLAPLPCRSRSIRCAGSTAVADTGSTRELKQGIAELYDESSAVWEDIWGDHMHHGFYYPDEVVSGSDSDHRAAQFRMIQEALSFAGVSGLLLFFLCCLSSIYIYISQLPKTSVL
jgi:tocopherol O-methyltransferase